MQQSASVEIWATPVPGNIALPNDPAIMTKEIHWGGEIEPELKNRARTMQMACTHQSDVHSALRATAPSSVKIVRVVQSVFDASFYIAT